MAKIKNLFEETKDYLARTRHTLDDVEWIGISGSKTIPKEEWEQVLNIEYDSDFGAVNINLDLVVVGDGWWLERSEYDGAEGWTFQTCPLKGEECTGVNIREKTLEEMFREWRGEEDDI